MSRGRPRLSQTKTKVFSDTTKPDKSKEYFPAERTGLSRQEQETIINFNKEEDVAYIFTYEYRWQKHLEKKFGLTPVSVNGFGGKEYVIDKKRISLPRVPKVKRILTDEQRQVIRDRFAKNRAKKPTVLL